VRVDLRGAVVAVTGASAGIGRATALAFAREGAQLAVCARRRERLDALALEAQALGVACLVREVDVADREQVRAFGPRAWPGAGR
jgi:NADP-dependent 3-hydroxy acid dehydrogenase YdfG